MPRRDASQILGSARLDFVFFPSASPLDRGYGRRVVLAGMLDEYVDTAGQNRALALPAQGFEVGDGPGIYGAADTDEVRTPLHQVPV